MALTDKASLADNAAHGNPIDGLSTVGPLPVREPIAWFRPRRPGEPAAVIRAERKPVYRTAYPYSPDDDIYATRVDISKVIPGDTFGVWTVVKMDRTLYRNHGWPCHCVWGMHKERGPYSRCSYSNPECPCYRFAIRYTVICRCICGMVKPVSVASLVTAGSLSCGHCRCKSYPCSCEVRYVG